MLLATVTALATPIAPILTLPGATPAAAAPVGSMTSTTGSLTFPYGITTGPDGNLWFTNEYGTSVGRMTTAGVITVFSDPAIKQPLGITTGPDGNLWFISSGSGSIGRLTPTGTFTFFTSPEIAVPIDITPGPDGNLWFTSRGNSRIGRITTSGAITTFAAGGAESPHGIVAGPDGNLWFTAAGTTAAVGRITTAGVSTVFTDPAITAPGLIAAGPDGNLWFPQGNGTIARITPSGQVSTFTDPNVSNPWGITAGPDGAMWFTSFSNGRVGRITTDGTITTYTSWALSGPATITTGPDGNLWVAAQDGGRGDAIDQVTPSGSITPFNDLFRPFQLTTGPDGNVWYTDLVQCRVGRITPAGDARTVTGTDVGACFGITVGPDGNLWFPAGRHTIARMSTAGAVTMFTDPALDLPYAITPGPDGNLWFTTNGGVGRITTAGDITTFPVPGSTTLHGIVTGPDGNLWATSTGAGAILRVTPEGAVTPFQDAGMGQPSAITVGPDGGLWFTDEVKSTIGRITTAGAVSYATGAEPAWGITTGPDGALWFTTANTLGRVRTDGQLTTFPLSSPTVPVGLQAGGAIVGPDGRIWFGNTRRQAITRATASPGGRFHPVTPFRLVDSRTGTGLPGPVHGGTTATAVVGGVGGIPSDAGAVVMNVTVTGGTSASYLSAFPAGGAVPATANVLFAPGQTVGNLVTVGLGAGSAVSFFNQQGEVHVVADVVGWYDVDAPPGLGDGFTALAPVRLLDSRTPVGGWNAALGPGASRELVVAGRGGIPLDATAVVLNVTVTDPSAASYLRLTPTGATPATTANLLFGPGQTVSNAVVVGLAPGGTGAGAVTVFNQAGTAQVVVDAVGYFEPGTGSLFHPISPARLVDDRTATGTAGGPWQAGETRTVGVTGSAIPVGATGLVANLTATNGTAPSYLAVRPGGAPASTTASLLFGAHQTIPNLVHVGVAGDGTIAVSNQLGSVDVVLDATGYFAPS